MLIFGDSIPEFVKKFREQLGFTQLDLANLLKVDPQYVSNIERGLHPRPLAFCKRMFKFIDKPRALWLEELMKEVVVKDFGDKRRFNGRKKK